MEKNKDILTNIDRNTGMKVPDGYFDGITSRIMEQLPDTPMVETSSPSLWQRVKPWVYMAAVFAGMALMVRTFVPQKKENPQIAASAKVQVPLTRENLEDYLFESNVDEYSVYEYLASGE